MVNFLGKLFKKPQKSKPANMKNVREILYGDHDPYSKVKKLPLDLQGWGSSDSSVFEEIIVRLKPKLIVEVGSWKGRSAVNIANTCLKYYGDFEIVCIDTWLGSVEHWLEIDKNLGKREFVNGRPTIYNKFLSNIVQSQLQEYITPFPIDSVNGAYTLSELKIYPDLIYIDAGHEYFSVKNDFYVFSLILKSGGYLLGDDFFHQPVKSAAYETFGDDKVVKLNEEHFLWIK